MTLKSYPVFAKLRGPQAEPHYYRNRTIACLAMVEVVEVVDGVDRVRVGSTTTASCNLAAVLELIGSLRNHDGNGIGNVAKRKV